MADGLKYTGVALARVAELRRDEAWLEARLAAAETRLVPVWRGHNLVAGSANGEGRPSAVSVSGDAATAAVAAAEDLVLLGLDGDVAYFAADLSSQDKDVAQALVPTGELMNLRSCGPLMSHGEAALLAYARAMVHWHQRHRFCGVCGHPTENRDGGHLRLCSNPDEAHQTFPRTDPAVIMLVSRDGDGSGPPGCLLGRQSIWPEGTYSTLAGFVEPGESLEEAVTREVLEEVGVRVTGVKYRASQPWPFPSSIMVGFWAQAVTFDINIDNDELEDAKWFTSVELRGFGEWGQSTGSPCLPRKDSISRWLIETWLEEIGA